MSSLISRYLGNANGVSQDAASSNDEEEVTIHFGTRTPLGSLDMREMGGGGHKTTSRSLKDKESTAGSQKTTASMRMGAQARTSMSLTMVAVQSVQIMPSFSRDVNANSVEKKKELPPGEKAVPDHETSKEDKMDKESFDSFASTPRGITNPASSSKNEPKFPTKTDSTPVYEPMSLLKKESSELPLNSHPDDRKEKR